MTVALLSSQGGHSGQMRILFTPQVLGNREAIFITESESVPYTVKAKGFQDRYKTYYFQKDVLLRLNPFAYVQSVVDLYNVFKKENIHLVITNGAQISITGAIAAKLLGIPVVFIDTVVRVKTPNWSARVCYWLSDTFIVQHASMAAKYGKKAIYRGEIL